MRKIAGVQFVVIVMSLVHVARVCGEELPAEAAKLFSDFELKAKEIEEEAATKLRQRKAELVKSLEKLRDSLAEARRFDDALTVHERIRELKIERVMVEWGGNWWPATVRERNGAEYLIHYDDYDDAWDERVTRDRIKFESAKDPPQAGKFRR